MGMFDNLKSDGLEEAQDRLGGFAPFNSDIYTGTIKAFYAGQSEGGALNVTLITDFGGKEYRETLYVTNKKGENFFLNKDDKTKKVPLPGFTIIDDICLITTGKPLSQQTWEEKTVKVYDREAKKELPKGVDMATDVVGQKISLAILNTLVNKNEKVGNEYVATAETRNENNIDKVFHPEQKITVSEARQDQSEPKFWPAWVERNKDQVRDKREIKDGQAGGARTAAPKAGEANSAPRKSLFGNKS